MTDRYKGFLVTLDREVRSDDAESIIVALKMVKGVGDVKPYVKTGEDYMVEEKAYLDAYQDILDVIRKKREEKRGLK